MGLNLFVNKNPDCWNKQNGRCRYRFTSGNHPAEGPKIRLGLRLNQCENRFFPFRTKIRFDFSARIGAWKCVLAERAFKWISSWRAKWPWSRVRAVRSVIAERLQCSGLGYLQLNGGPMASIRHVLNSLWSAQPVFFRIFKHEQSARGIAPADADIRNLE